MKNLFPLFIPPCARRVKGRHHNGYRSLGDLSKVTQDQSQCCVLFAIAMARSIRGCATFSAPTVNSQGLQIDPGYSKASVWGRKMGGFVVPLRPTLRISLFTGSISFGSAYDGPSRLDDGTVA